jgi:hypothetical protein
MFSTQSSVVVHETLDSRCRKYFTHYKLFTPQVNELLGERHFNGTTRLHLDSGGDAELTCAGWRVADGLFHMAGVNYVVLNPREVTIYRCSAFDWEDMDERIQYVLDSADPMYPRVIGPQPPPKKLRRIRWFLMPDGDTTNYGLTTRLFHPQHSLDVQRRIYGGPNEEKPFLPRAEAMVKALCRVKGVETFNVNPFEVKAHHSGIHSFEKTHDSIVQVLRTAFEGNAEVIVENRGNQWVDKATDCEA